MRTRSVRNATEEGGFLEKSDNTQESNMHIKEPSKSSRTPTKWDESSDAPTPELPTIAFDFFSMVQQDGYPEDARLEKKSQPWKSIWTGPKSPSEDGKLLVACPKAVVYGSNSGLGGY